jgi:hypothetical protein
MGKREKLIKICDIQQGHLLKVAGKYCELEGVNALLSVSKRIKDIEELKYDIEAGRIEFHSAACLVFKNYRLVKTVAYETKTAFAHGEYILKDFSEYLSSRIQTEIDYYRSEFSEYLDFPHIWKEIKK